MNKSLTGTALDPIEGAKSVAQYWKALRLSAVAKANFPAEKTDKSSLYSWCVYGNVEKKSSIGTNEIESLLRMEQGAVNKFLEINDRAAFALLPVLDGTPFEISDVTTPPSSRLAQAMSLVEMLWPAQYREIHATISGILWIKSQSIYSGSDPKRFGLIFLNPFYYADRGIPELGTAIVHETAHHALYVETARDRLFLDDPAKMMYSPLRRGPRPAIGVLHAVFTLARMFMWARQLEAIRTPDAQAEVASLITGYGSGFISAVNALASIRWTSRGQALMAELRLEAAKLAPRVEYYETLNNLQSAEGAH